VEHSIFPNIEYLVTHYWVQTWGREGGYE